MRRFIKWPSFLRSKVVILVILILIIAGSILGVRDWYNHNLAAVSNNTQTIYYTVASGSSVHDIAVGLKQDDLIRSTRAFETYVRGKSLFGSLQAGTYALNQSMSTPQIVQKMVNGDVSKNLFTILPGKTIAQIRQSFKQAGYSDSELDVAFNPTTYPDEPVIANLPAGASLEGFLYPDSFQRESTTPAQTIIRESLEEMQQHLTADVISGFSAQGLTVYQGVTLASIVYQESGDPNAEPTVAQVFLLRLKQGMMLGSDVTAFYAAGLVGQDHNLGVDSPYNTRLHTGLPPGPIGNLVDNALKAVAHPSNSDYLFFVAGDNGVIHFAHTDAEQQQNIKQYCTKQCS